MENNALTTAQENLIKLLSASFKEEKISLQGEADYAALFTESREQAVSLQAFDALGDGDNNPALNAWKGFSIKSMLKNMEIHKQHGYLHKLMEKSGIDYCVLKGSASAFYYKRPDLRAMGDVDFLVAEKDVKKAIAALTDAGFSIKNDKHICHYTFKKGLWCFELHFEPAGLPKGKAGGVLREYLADVFEKSVQASIGSFTFKKPDDFHHGLVLIMHTYHHLLSEGIGLRHLCDFAAFINSLGDDFAGVFESRLKEAGLSRFAKILGGMCHICGFSPYYSWMGEIDESYCKAILLDILCGGNFGTKDSERKQQGLAISDRGKDSLEKPPLIQYIASLNEQAVVQFPVIKKLKLLKPFGFIMLAARRTARVISGKRKMPELGGVLEKAAERKELYKNLHLLEREE